MTGPCRGRWNNHCNNPIYTYNTVHVLKNNASNSNSVFCSSCCGVGPSNKQKSTIKLISTTQLYYLIWLILINNNNYNTKTSTPTQSIPEISRPLLRLSDWTWNNYMKIACNYLQVQSVIRRGESLYRRTAFLSPIYVQSSTIQNLTAVYGLATSIALLRIMRKKCYM